MDNLMRRFLALALALVPSGAFAQDAPDKDTGNPYGLTDEQWEHVQEGNVGRAEALQVGEPAPDFDLLSLDGESRTRLAEFRGKRPVVLFFGSYT
jgi:hypothetical protein